MKNLALMLVVMLFLALTIAADDGQIPIGGKTDCTGTCPTSLAQSSEPTDSETSSETSIFEESLILGFQSIPVMM